jgi:hypothetical protein
MATVPKMPPPPAKSDDEKTNIPIGDPLEQVGVGRKRRASRRRGGFVLQDPNLRSGPAPVGPQGPLGGRRRTRKHKGKKHHTRRRRGGNTPLPATKRCDYDSKCSHSANGKHDWGLVGRGNYVCQNKCGCYFDDR